MEIISAVTASHNFFFYNLFSSEMLLLLTYVGYPVSDLL